MFSKAVFPPLYYLPAMLIACHNLRAIIALLLFTSCCLAAPPKVDYLFPAGVQRGKTVEVTAAGTFANWPVNIWLNRPGIQVVADKTKGKLKITAAADADPGVYWLRMYDKGGATTLRPFVVGTLPEVAEKEPNDAPDKPQKLTASATINGKLGKGGDVDTYSIKLNGGQTLVASMRANTTLGSPMDGVLQICNSDGFVLDQNDEGRGFDPQIAFTAPREGIYLVRTFAFPIKTNSSIAYAGGANFVYRLTVSTVGFIDHTLPLALKKGGPTEVELFGWNISPADSKQTISVPSMGRDTVAFHPKLAGWLHLPATDHAGILAAKTSGPQTPQAIKIPSVISGRIESPRDDDTFLFNAKKGQRFRLRAESRALGFPLDPLIRVSDKEGKVLVEADDIRGNRTARDSETVFAAPADGEYQLTIRDLHRQGGMRYVYRLTVEEAKPNFTLKLAAGEFNIEAGKTLEIPVTIERLERFADEIEITAAGLPEGVTATPVKSLAKGATAKAVKLKLTAADKLGSGTITIVGKSLGKTPLSRTAEFSLADLAAQHRSVWLTVIKAAKKK